jgi:uncharacterized membrane protein
MAPFFEFLGRLHPALVHLPIGFTAAAVLLELRAMLTGRMGAPRFLVGLAAGAALAAAGAGWLLHLEEGYDTEAVLDHRNSALAAGGVLVLAFGAQCANKNLAYRVLLFLAGGLIGLTGHLGGSITHGDGYLFEPFEDEAGESSTIASAPLDDAGASSTSDATVHAANPEPALDPVSPASSGPSYALQVAPIFAARCTSCHGEKKRKGGLRLDSRQGIELGGVDGKVLVAGDAAGSEIVRRLRLPLDDDDHMPPDGKPQPSPEQIALLEQWSGAGAPFDADAPPRAASEAPTDPQTSDAESETDAASEARATQPADGPPAAALALLRQSLVHAELLGQRETRLWIDFAGAGRSADDALAQRLLEPLLPWIGELSLARTSIGNATLALAFRAEQLERLDLRATSVDDAGFAHLRGHARLRELVLVKTRVGDASLDVLRSLPSLSKLYAWQSALTPDAIATLRAERPELTIEAGDTPPAAAREIESVVQLGQPAPPPADVPVATPVKKPINDRCPVSGTPVDPAHVLEFEGRIIGFCCPNCPKQFAADPKAFLAKLPPP